MLQHAYIFMHVGVPFFPLLSTLRFYIFPFENNIFYVYELVAEEAAAKRWAEKSKQHFWRASDEKRGFIKLKPRRWLFLYNFYSEGRLYTESFSLTFPLFFIFLCPFFFFSIIFFIFLATLCFLRRVNRCKFCCCFYSWKTWELKRKIRRSS